MEEAREEAGPMVEAESDWRRGVEGEIWSGRGAGVGDAISAVSMVFSLIGELVRKGSRRMDINTGSKNRGTLEW